ncbi:hypothetical protein [Pseudomonas putida]|uniref:Uncharacterized protein n=1 Tax=Pseudomonas putida TaxID=303 RepID=A0A8I1ECX6_PSEPU|nr:hypothetical protein [Pseudomonas putida]MBI6883226.1 hypothetical protein [Pseudomonas putida]
MSTGKSQRNEGRGERTATQIEKDVQDHIEKNQSLYQSWFVLARANPIDDRGALAGADRTEDHTSS